MTEEVLQRHCPVGETDCPLIAEAASLRQENSELRATLGTDSLTGLFNYRHLQECLDTELERTRRTRNPTALIMLDLDHFKRVNDDWGHEVGNRALKSTAAILKASARKLDIPCRYGGEEFALILPGTPLLAAIEVAERVRSAIEAAPLKIDGKELKISASLGVDIYRADMLLGVDEFIHLADGYLYQAKQHGRNRVAHPALQETTSVTADERAALFS